MFKYLIPALGVLAMTTTAQAHATLEQTEAVAGATTKLTLRVGHGCKGEATHTVRIGIPEGVYSVKPMPKAGWTLQSSVGPYATPYDNHGTMMTQGVREVVWSGGALEDAWYDEFVVRGVIGPDVAAGTVLYFPAVQTCANGTADWTDVSGVADVPNPAPKLTVTSAQSMGGHGMHAGQGMGGHGMGAGQGMGGQGMGGQGMGGQAMGAAVPEMQSAPIDLGDLSLSGAFARATLPNAPVAGGFLTVTNTGTSDDRLVAAASDVAGRMEIHEMAMQGDVMKMRPLADGLPIPAGASVELKPGGYHLMFMDLKQPLVEGQTVTVTLTFEAAGTVEVPLQIAAPGAKGAMKH